MKFELGEGHRGLHSDTLKSGKRLIVVDAKTAGAAALQTITHELVHDIEGTRGYAKLKKAAVASTSEARRREITDMYVRQYGAESYTDWLGDRQGTPETWQEYLDAHPDIDGEAVTSEVVAKAVGEKLGDLGFIRKYGEKNILTRALGSLKRLYKALRADKATGAAIGTTARLGRMFETALGQMDTTGVKRDTAKVYSLVGTDQGNEIIDIIEKNQRKIKDGILFEAKSKDIREYSRKSDYVLAVFNEQGNIAHNSSLGDVELGRSGAKSTVAHGYGKEKIATVEAIKSTIENGSIISETKNYQGKDIDRYIIASRGLVDGAAAVMGVVIKSYPKNDSRPKFYLHEAKIIEADVSSMTAPQSSVDTVNTSASSDSISQTAANVNSFDKNKSTQKFDLTESRTDVTETANFRRWFGDWQADPESASKVVDENGRPKIVYHQTENDFTVFDIMREGAGARDNETPFGIFLKSSNKDIGLRGKKQMALYASIKNPLVVANRAELVQRLSALSSKYSELYERSKSIDKEYKAKVEKAVKAFNDFVIKNSQSENRKTRQELYEDAEFLKLFDAEDNLIDEWTNEASKNDLLMKNEIVRALKSEGYDGVVLREDSGSFGRMTDAYIALNASQVKSVICVEYLGQNTHTHSYHWEI